MGVKQQLEVYVGVNSAWCFGDLVPTSSRFAAMDFAWNYLWRLLYNRNRLNELGTLKGVKLRCSCKARYCHSRILKALAENPKLAFDLQRHVTMQGLKQTDYDSDSDRYPAAKEVLQRVWSEAGFNNTSPEEKEVVLDEQVSLPIGMEILETMRAMGDQGTLDPEVEIPYEFT